MLTRDVERAQEFYVSVFGYSAEGMDVEGGTYTVLSVGGRQVAG